MKIFDSPSIIGALFAVMLILTLQICNFYLSFSGQPIAHSQHLWNILGMYAVGFAAFWLADARWCQIILQAGLTVR